MYYGASKKKHIGATPILVALTIAQLLMMSYIENNQTVFVLHH